MERLGRFILPRLAATLLGAAVVCVSWLVLRGDFLEDRSLPPSGVSQPGPVRHDQPSVGACLAKQCSRPSGRFRHLSGAPSTA